MPCNAPYDAPLHVNFVIILYNKIYIYILSKATYSAIRLYIVLSVCVPGNWTHNFYAANAMLTTEPQEHTDIMYYNTNYDYLSCIIPFNNPL